MSVYLNELNTDSLEADYWDDRLGFTDGFDGPVPEWPTPFWNLADSGLNARDGVITYNIGGNDYDADGILGATRIDAIRHALDIYETILGIDFVETDATDADLNFGDEIAGQAFANFNQSADGSIINAWVNIAQDWAGDGTLGDYYFHAALREIGTALGLGRPGNYSPDNGDMTYDVQAQWRNDTIQFSMMSYWAQDNYTAPGQATPSGSALGDVNVVGPQVVDWVTLDRMYSPMGYGLANGATGGDTVWGFNTSWTDWTPGTTGPAADTANSVFASLDTLLATSTLSLVDTGGIDTLDLSGFANSSRIDMRVTSASNIAPSLSDVGGLIGNLSLAPGTIIENIIGGAGDEVIYGNDADNIIDGGAGNDTIHGEGGNDTLFGGLGDDVLSGGNGNDFLEGGAGADIMTGGAGDDIFLYRNGGADLAAGETVTGGSGTDRVQLEGGGYFDFRRDVHASLSVERLELTGDAPGVTTVIDATYASFSSIVNETPSAGASHTLRLHIDGSTIWSPSVSFSGWNTVSDDRLELIGGENNDEIWAPNQDQTIYGNGGHDEIYIWGTGAHTEIYGGVGGDQIIFNYGNVLRPTIVVDGGADVDTIRIEGHGTFDFREVQVSSIERIAALIDPWETIIEISSEQLGTSFASNLQLEGDYWLSSPDVTLRIYAENGVSDIDVSAFTFLWWNHFGNDGYKIELLGDATDNVLIGSTNFDNLQGGAGNDTLRGGDRRDTLNGGSGDDLLDGGEGDDRMIGGLGDDIYLLQDEGDVIIENPDSGTDLIISDWDSVGLGKLVNVENLTGSATTGQILAGNYRDNVITGNIGDDRIYGSYGNDTLFGRAGDDFLDGGTGDDLMYGGAGDDTYIVFDVADAIVEWADGGVDTVETRLTFWELSDFDNVENLTGTNSEGQILGGNDLDNVIIGAAGNDTLDGGLGNDTLDGGAGDDFMSGWLGDDTYVVDSLGDTVVEGEGRGTDTVLTALASLGLTHYVGVENLTGTSAAGQTLAGNALDNVITGHIGDDALYGGAGNDTLRGLAGDDVLNGGLGDDIMNGGTGDDLYLVDSAGDQIVEWAGGGIDTVRTELAYLKLSYDNVENLTGLSAGGQTLSGNALDNVITGHIGDDALYGGLGDDWLDGRAGADIMNGGQGDDTYVVDDLADIITESFDGGVDTVRTALSALGLKAFDEVENLTGTSAAGQSLTGNALDNVLTGNTGDDLLYGRLGADQLLAGAGDDWLNGGAGADIMSGGAGDDTYVVDNAGDVIIEWFDKGIDTVRTGLASFSLGAIANVENLLATTGDGQVLGGNVLDNVITGRGGDDALYGGRGDDTLDGRRGDDLLYGRLGADQLLAGAGDDWLNGGAGADIMSGGAGDDTYVVDNAGDVIVEWFDKGIDTVRTGLASFSLGAIANVENLMATTGDGQVLGGNVLDNVITGRGGDDALYGGRGDDTLDGRRGDDLLNGGEGDDLFLFAAGFGQDRIADFHAGASGEADVISISSDLIADFADLLSRTADVGADTVITVNASNSITLLGVQKADLDSSDFWFA
ncbi:M10 family metallopeptidase C-terminal domain-containing protein [Pseudodonghicola flavimaris]|uniref:M10 family metallopeptidase C-terminal domain-containing protein n=1 Tax=Pseudodonghicola flavimaris TaxID=3050036 RepID=A0ABT7F158_9RHOB|nr:M10 family metallopeptidase C-terminal domain-containing protein [Pseudodonghicola flavimaris]MDK3018340.1 M10 family metallopeptidase C-terminal domain-containing protein [Pseudodonghicola flavimaris]